MENIFLRLLLIFASYRMIKWNNTQIFSGVVMVDETNFNHWNK